MSQEYGAEQIQVLEGLEAVRKRPGMYIGSTSIRGLHHLVYEIVDNSVDEALAGFCDTIDVQINEDNSVTVTDNGRGMPVGMHPKGVPAVQVIFTVLHAGGKFGGGAYKVSGGLHGVGASVVNALSEWLEVQICSGGKIYSQRYERGNVVTDLKVIGSCSEEEHGSSVTFKPDAQIFEETVFSYDTLKQRLREMAFLTKGLKIKLHDVRENSKHDQTFHYEGGIKEFVTYLNRSNAALYPDVIYCEGEKDGVQYHFTSREEFERLKDSGKVIEYRIYDTFYGEWIYYTVADNIDISNKNYLIIGTPESFDATKKYFGDEAVLPILINVDDGVRLARALKRERKQEKPKYEEMCRRFLADAQDFSADNLKKSGIDTVFDNEVLEECVENVISYILKNI